MQDQEDQVLLCTLKTPSVSCWKPKLPPGVGHGLVLGGAKQRPAALDTQSSSFQGELTGPDKASLKFRKMISYPLGEGIY